MGREGDDGNLESKSLGCRGICCNGRKLVSVEGGDCSKRSNFLQKPTPFPRPWPASPGSEAVETKPLANGSPTKRLKCQPLAPPQHEKIVRKFDHKYHGVIFCWGVPRLFVLSGAFGACGSLYSQIFITALPHKKNGGVEKHPKRFRRERVDERQIPPQKERRPGFP